MSRIYSRITRVASWAGWCTPCQREDRPLVLTRSGPGGLRSWLAGMSDDDRILLLTCRVCGAWQLVPAREEDDPEIVLGDGVDPAVTEELVVAGDLVAAGDLIAAGDLVAAAPAPLPVPAPRVAEPPAPLEQVLPGELLAGLLAEISAVVQESEHAPPPPVPAPAVASVPAVVPAPRPAEPVAQVAFAPALPQVLGLPVGTRQLVLALAS